MYGQYSRAVSNQERVKMARVRYVLEENVCKDTLTMSKFGSFEEQLYQIFNKTIHKYLHKYIPTIDRDDIRGPSVPIFVEYVVYKRRNVKSVVFCSKKLFQWWDVLQSDINVITNAEEYYKTILQSFVCRRKKLNYSQSFIISASGRRVQS